MEHNFLRLDSGHLHTTCKHNNTTATAFLRIGPGRATPSQGSSSSSSSFLAAEEVVVRPPQSPPMLNAELREPHEKMLVDVEVQVAILAGTSHDNIYVLTILAR